MTNQTASSVREISIVLGNDPHARLIKEGKVKDARINLKFDESYKPMNKAFDPMVRHQAFDVCEMAIGTFFQALDAGKPLRLLPIVMNGEFHHGSIWVDPANGPVSPADLKGRRVGVRAYTQTTGLWVRGILREQYGISSDDVTWVTAEAPHVEDYINPSNVELAEGADLSDMLRAGELTAVIMGPKQGGSSGLQHLITDIDAAVSAWHAKHQTVPINHMVVVTDALLKNDISAVEDICNMFKQAIETTRQEASDASPSSVRYGADRVWATLELAMRYAVEQRLISRIFGKDEVFGGMSSYN
jgi:4,5-dihydroxyphthalate decarboxylase